jgi:hypothetical protein
MKRIVILAIIAIAVWQARLHWDDLFHRRPSHQAVIVNDGKRTLVRVRLKVGSQTFVREQIDPGARATIPFQVSNDARLGMEWGWSDSPNEQVWTGGLVPAGPAVQRWEILVHDDGAVIYTTGPVPPPS